MKKLLILLCSLLLVPTISFGESLNLPTYVYLHGQELGNFEDVQMIHRDNRIYLPVRKTSEILSYRVDWKEETRQVLLKKDDQTVSFTIGKKTYMANGKEFQADVAPFIENNRTYLPMRFLVEALGEEVHWDGDQRVAIVGDLDKKEVQGERVQLAPGISMTLGEGFKDQYTYEAEVNPWTLYEAKNYEADKGTGLLGEFKLTKDLRAEVPAYLIQKVGDRYLMFFCPSDVNYDIDSEDLTKAYHEANKNLVELLRTVQVEDEGQVLEGPSRD